MKQTYDNWEIIICDNNSTDNTVRLIKNLIKEDGRVKIIQKKHQGKKLTPDEKKNFHKAWKVSSLLTTFGKTAQIVMAAYGVGPDTAARILKNRLEDDDDYLIKQIIIAEKTYTLTRGFWKD